MTQYFIFSVSKSKMNNYSNFICSYTISILTTKQTHVFCVNPTLPSVFSIKINNLSSMCKKPGSKNYILSFLRNQQLPNSLCICDSNVHKFKGARNASARNAHPTALRRNRRLRVASFIGTLCSWSLMMLTAPPDKKGELKAFNPKIN